MTRPDLSLYIGQKVTGITTGTEKWEWGIKLESGVEIRNKDVKEIFHPMGLVNMRFTSLSLSTRDSTLHFSGGGASKVIVGLKPTGYTVFDPRYGNEIFPQWPEELDEMGITANEGMAPPNPPPSDAEKWKTEKARLEQARQSRIEQSATEFLKEEK